MLGSMIQNEEGEKESRIVVVRASELEVIDTLQHDFAHGNICASWYQEHLEKLTPISNKYYSEEYSKEQDRISRKLAKELEEADEAEAEEAKISE